MALQEATRKSRVYSEVRLCLEDWIGEAVRGRNVFFITLTTNKPIRQPEFEEAIRHWLRRLKAAYLGRSGTTEEIFFFVVFEKTHNEQLHAHVLIDDISNLPSDKTFECIEPFIKKAIDEWTKLDLAGVRSAQNIQSSFDSAGALGYLLKNVWNDVSLDRVPFNLISLPTKYKSSTSHVPWINNKAKRMRKLTVGVTDLDKDPYCLVNEKANVLREVVTTVSVKSYPR